MNTPDLDHEKTLKKAIINTLKIYHAQSDRIARIANNLAPEYLAWTEGQIRIALEDFAKIEVMAATELNYIYKSEIADRNGTDRDTPEIRAKLDKCHFPAITRAMLNQEEYESLIYDEILSYL